MSANVPDVALKLAQRYPAEPKTLVRAAMKSVAQHPEFALDLCIAALRWMAGGPGYDLTSLDVCNAFKVGRTAAERIGALGEYRTTVKVIADDGRPFIRDALGSSLD